MQTWNFGAGPAMLPHSVLKQIQNELLDWKQGMSVMEFGHRTKEIEALFFSLEQNFRSLLAIPSEFAVLFMHGGARAQFSAIPLNLLAERDTANYLITGHWSNQAALEAKKFANIHIGLDITQSSNGFIPVSSDNWVLNPAAIYTHYTDNETIEGIEFLTTPNLSLNANPPNLIADITSSILSKPIDWSKMGAAYASAQKNLGIAGMCVLIIRRSLLNNNNNRAIPAILDFSLMAETQSMYNTPPVFACYVALLITEWVMAQGGVQAMQDLCEQRSRLLYDYIDNSNFYVNSIDPASRSRINIPFNIKNNPTELEPELLALATAQGFKQIKGHRVKGGFRASMYNAMPLEGVQALVNLLKQFEQKNR
jgi:phosphoserine aminotransferase